MERRSWLWKRKSSDKSLGETESSGSVSSFSERCSDDQETIRASPNNDSSNHVQSPEMSSKIASMEANETVKGLTEKLSAALSNISAKEDLVKQHMKVAEEAVSGWEKAETEVAVLKQQLDAAVQKNSVLEERIGHLDGALKESVRQLRQSREEQEKKVHDEVMKKIRKWESDKFELENHINELQVQLEAAKAEAATSSGYDIQSKLEASEKENASLKVELLARAEAMQMQILDKELSNRAAETASKQHLESIKKVAKLEAECSRLRAAARRIPLGNDHKPIANCYSGESLTDSQSDSGERFLDLEKTPICSDTWASALITELDQFKNDKVNARNLAGSVEIDLMDDFLEMERLVAMPEAKCGSSGFELSVASTRVLTIDDPTKGELEFVRHQMGELEEKIVNMENEKRELEMSLIDTQNRLELSFDQLSVAEDTLVALQRHLESAKESELVSKREVIASKGKEKELESQLESTQLEVEKLREKMFILEGKIEKEKAVSAKLAAKVESVEGERKALGSQLELSDSEVEKLRKKTSMLEDYLEAEKTVAADFAAKVDSLEAERKALVIQLESANSKVTKLHEELNVLEKQVEEAKTVSAATATEVEISEAARKALECELESAHLEVRKLQEKVLLLEGKFEEEKSSSADFAAKAEVANAARKALQSQLESAHLEVRKLHNKIGLLEDKLEEEKSLSVKLTSKFQNSMDIHSKNKLDGKLKHVINSNGELNIKQEKEFAIAAGKLAECQKTIASLSQQLNLLASIDDFLLDADKPEVIGGSIDVRKGAVRNSETEDDFSDNTVHSALHNGKDEGYPPSLPLSRFARFISRSKAVAG